MRGRKLNKAEAVLCLLLVYVHRDPQSLPLLLRFGKGVEISKGEWEREIGNREGEMGQSGVVNQPLKTQQAASGGNFLYRRRGLIRRLRRMREVFFFPPLPLPREEKQVEVEPIVKLARGL